MRRILSTSVAALVLACAITAAAQQPEKGAWRAASHTTASVIGDITISGSKLTIDFTAFPLSPVRGLKPEEVSAAFDEAVDTAGPGSLYRLNVPAARRMMGHNTLCGTEDTRWMATYVADKTLKIAFFSGDDEPLMTFDALQKATNLCGTYTFVR